MLLFKIYIVCSLLKKLIKTLFGLKKRTTKDIKTQKIENINIYNQNLKTNSNIFLNNLKSNSYK